MRDYKKGKNLLETRPGQLLPIGVSKDGRASSSAEQQQKRILDKVWASVEKAMGEMKSVLMSQLHDHSRSIEEQDKTLESVFTTSHFLAKILWPLICAFQTSFRAILER